MFCDLFVAITKTVKTVVNEHNNKAKIKSNFQTSELSNKGRAKEEFALNAKASKVSLINEK